MHNAESAKTPNKAMGYCVPAPQSASRACCLAVLGPLVLSPDLFLLLGCEVVGDVEGLADLLGRLALDHVGHGLAADVKQGLDVHVVCRLGEEALV